MQSDTSNCKWYNYCYVLVVTCGQKTNEKENELARIGHNVTARERPSCWQRWRWRRCHRVVQRSVAARRTMTSCSGQPGEAVVPSCDQQHQPALRDPTAAEPCPGFPPHTRSVAHCHLAPDRRHHRRRHSPRCSPCDDDLGLPTGRSPVLRSTQQRLTRNLS